MMDSYSDQYSTRHKMLAAINDQIIVITAAEVIEMAEKATLQAYRNAINDYLASTGGVYPWLYSYDNILTLDEFPDRFELCY